MSLRESCIQENRTYSLSGGRRPAHKRASSNPTLSNNTTYGLAGGVWTSDVQKAHTIARALQSGVVWVNCFNVMDPAVPFGGYKMSGYGRDSGVHALEQYTQVKSVWVNLG